MKQIGAAIDIETTGLTAGVHEIVEITIILHDEKFIPLEKFTSQIRPMKPELAEEKAIEVNNLNLTKLKDAPTPPMVRNAFFQWHEEIVKNKQIFPLGQNYGGFDKGFIKLFFGHFYDDYFYYKNRDTFALAQALKDCGLLNLDQSLSLENLCKCFNISYDSHTSYGDALATLTLYKKLINLIKNKS